MATEAQPDLNDRLSPNELKALHELLTRLKRKCGGHIVQIALFGSKSRGDDRPDSDMDLLVILQEENWQFQRTLIEIGSEVGMKYDVIFDLRIIGKQRWDYMASIHAALYQTISKDAIPFAI